MKYMKRMRVQAPENIKVAGERACQICQREPTEVHHLISRGAGGGDEMSNLIALCRFHHFEIHNLGAHSFWRKYPQVNQ